MRIRLLNYLNEEHFVEVPDDTNEIEIKVISGDMVMTSPVRYDTSNDRIMNYNDGTFCLDKDKFGLLDTVESTRDFIYKMYEFDE